MSIPKLSPIRSSSEPETAIVAVDPATAQRWLDHNTRNRNLRAGHAASLARDMSAGNWRFNGEAIKFAADGSLLDGQHRLAAVVSTGRTIDFLVVRGLEADTQVTMDSGSKRTAGDALKLLSKEQATVLASVVRLCIRMQEQKRCTTAEIISFLNDHPELEGICADIVPGLGIPSKMMNRTITGYTYWRLSQIDDKACHVFFTSLGTGENLPKGSPILVLQRRLFLHQTLSDGYQSRREAISLVFQAWNAWKRGEIRTKLQLNIRDGRVAITEPIGDTK